MDMTTLLISILFIGLFLTPFLYSRYAKQNKQSRFLAALRAISEPQSLSFSVVDIWNESAIGYDPGRKVLAYVHFAGDQLLSQQVIPLQDISACKLYASSHEVNTPNGHKRVTDRLELQLTHKNGQMPLSLITFYEAEKNFLINGELQLINKWDKLVKEAIGK